MHTLMDSKIAAGLKANGDHSWYESSYRTMKFAQAF